MSFSEIMGQDHNIKVLQRSIERDRLHHAYIFSGPAGVGKRLTALSLAKALNCLEMKGDFCGHCIPCRKIEAGNHPDVKVLEPVGQLIRIEQIREIQHDLQFGPFEGRKRIFIIDNADRLGLPAGNALLKTLEEPPGDSILILVTANFHSLLPTVASRCQRLTFPSLPISAVERILMDKNGDKAGTARILAAISEGSIGMALTEDGSRLLAERGKAIAEFTGLRGRGMMAAFKTAEELAKDDDLEGILKALKVLYRDMAVLKGGGSSAINSDMVPRIREEAADMEMDDIIGGFEFVSETEDLLRRNINRQLAMEVLMIRLTDNSLVVSRKSQAVQSRFAVI